MKVGVPLTNKMDPRQLKTQEKLHMAALHIFSKTEHQPTIKDICDVAGITRPTFYNHYASIDALKEALTALTLADMKKSLTFTREELKTEFSIEEMPNIFKKLFSHIEKNWVFYETFLVNRKDKTLCDEIFNILKEYIEKGMDVVQPKVDYFAPKDLIIHYVSGAYYECIVWWITNKKPYPAEEMYTYMVHLSLKGPYSNIVSQYIDNKK